MTQPSAKAFTRGWLDENHRKKQPSSEEPDAWVVAPLLMLPIPTWNPLPKVEPDKLEANSVVPETWPRSP